MKECTNDEEDTIFVDFMEESNNEKKIYMEIPQKERLELRIFVEKKLEDYNAN